MSLDGGALEGLRVIDATQMVAGSLAGARLGDLGADVIKLEPPQGEFNRTHGFAGARIDGEMTTFVAMNRNKRSACIDLKSEDGREAALRLAASADIFLQNFRLGTAERLGVGYEDLAAINSGIIYCAITGYGRSGPHKDRPGQDLIIQGYSGSMFSVGSLDDPPLPGSLWAADSMAAYQAVIGILAAVQSRHRTGLGQRVDIDMLSVVMDSQLQEIVTYLNTGVQPQRSHERSAHALIPAPYGVYRTKDSWMTLAMCPLTNLGEVLDDDWLRSLSDYNDGFVYRDEIYTHIRSMFESRTTSQWLEICDRQGVWAGPVYDYKDLENDPHVKETGIFVNQPSDGPADIRTTRVPIVLSGTPAGIRRGAPRLGADTYEVLREVGYEDSSINAMVDSGAVTAAAHELNGAGQNA